MGEGNRLQVNLVSMSPDGDVKRSGGKIRPTTLQGIINWIVSQEFDEYTKQGLIELASKYPTSALGSFRKNIHLMLSRVRATQMKGREPNGSQEEIGVKEIIEPIIERAFLQNRSSCLNNFGRYEWHGE
jgi:hypothetical protein